VSGAAARSWAGGLWHLAPPRWMVVWSWRTCCTTQYGGAAAAAAVVHGGRAERKNWPRLMSDDGAAPRPRGPVVVEIGQSAAS